MSDLVPVEIIEPAVEKTHPIGTGVQRLYAFPNGYGASVVQFEIAPGVGSYGAAEGLWELAVIKYDADSSSGFDLAYDTPIADDVVGRLSDDEVQDYLRRIRDLPHCDATPVHAAAAIEAETAPIPSEIELYAVELVHEGATSCAEDDLDEAEVLSERDWRKARDLGLDMAKAIREHQEQFLAWYRQVTA